MSNLNDAFVTDAECTSLTNEIVRIAKNYADLGFKERPNNGGFIDPTFDKEMRSMGFRNGQAWCMYFAKLVYYKAATNLKLEGFAKRTKLLMNGGTQDSFNNCDKANDFDTTKFKILKKIRKGSIVIYRFGNTSNGHAGVVIEDSYFWNLRAITIKSVDGNSNDNGSREGTKIVTKVRTTGLFTSSMFIRGIICPKIQN